MHSLSIHCSVLVAGRTTQRGRGAHTVDAGKKRPANTHISRLDMAKLDVMEMFHGILFPGHLHTQDSLQLALKFPFRDTDILIVSYPKSGKKRGQTDQDTNRVTRECTVTHLDTMCQYNIFMSYHGLHLYFSD